MTEDAYRRRRRRLMEHVGEGVDIIPAATETLRNGDVVHDFRQDSDFRYLTGFPEPEAIAVLRPGADEEYTLFVRPRDKEKEIWTGRRAGVEGAKERYGADAAYVLEELDARLPDLLKGRTDLYYRFGKHADLDRRVQGTLDGLRARNREGVRLPGAIIDPSLTLGEMRLKKDPQELETMRRAGAITADGHAAAMRAVRPGMREADLQAVVEYVFRRGGAQTVGYGSIVATGANACVLHYVENAARIQDGDLVLIDAGAELDGYSADITRTFPASGRFTEPQRELYQVVLDAQLACIEASKPGAGFQEIHDLAVRHLVEGLLRLGLLSGTPEEVIAAESYKRFYMHRTGHWLGMDVHDVGTYHASEGVTRTLEPGMVMTIEPGLYVAEDDQEAPERYRGIGIRIEDDVLITTDGHENLTAGVPKDVEAIEALMREDAVLPL